MTQSPLGLPVRRNEDPRLLTGSALFIDGILVAADENKPDDTS